jgi:hypothetical protein
LENISLLSKIDLPIYSEEDGKTLRSLQIEFENISEITKKINTNNHWKEQLGEIDLPKMREQLEKYSVKKRHSRNFNSDRKN